MKLSYIIYYNIIFKLKYSNKIIYSITKIYFEILLTK